MSLPIIAVVAALSVTLSVTFMLRQPSQPAPQETQAHIHFHFGPPK